MRRTSWIGRLSARAGLLPRCSASGWQVQRGCADDTGSAVCPRCERRVPTEDDRVTGMAGVRRIKIHHA